MSAWTKEPPSEPGWYWWRTKHQTIALQMDETGRLWHGLAYYLEPPSGGEWQRVEPPKE